MNSILLNIFFVLAFLFGNPSISNDITEAIKNGQAHKVADHFGTSVDLSTPDNEGVYSKMQAQLILKTFFVKNKPTDFKVVHNGNSKNNSHYSIGNLTTEKSKFRVYILYSLKDQKTTILELKIESDE